MNNMIFDKSFKECELYRYNSYNSETSSTFEGSDFEITEDNYFGKFTGTLSYDTFSYATIFDPNFDNKVNFINV